MERKLDTEDCGMTLMEQIAEVSQGNEEARRKIIDSSKINTIPLFLDFEEVLLRDLINLYAIFHKINEDGGRTSFWETEGKINIHVQYSDYRRYEEYNQALGVKVSSEQDNIDLIVFPKRKGILRKETGKYLIKLCGSLRRYNPSKDNYDMTRGIEELRKREEEHYRYLMRNSLFSGRVDELKDYELIIKALKNLPQYIIKGNNRENRLLKDSLEGLSQD